MEALAVVADEDQRVVAVDDAAVAERLGDRVARLAACILEAAGIDDRAAAEIDAGDPLGRRVHQRHPAGGVGDDDRFADAGQGDREALVLGGERRGGRSRGGLAGARRFDAVEEAVGKAQEEHEEHTAGRGDRQQPERLFDRDGDAHARCPGTSAARPTQIVASQLRIRSAHCERPRANCSATAAGKSAAMASAACTAGWSSASATLPASVSAAMANAARWAPSRRAMWRHASRLTA